MRDAAESLPSLPTGPEKPSPSTGISDGTWYADRLDQIERWREDQIRKQKREEQGMLERFTNRTEAVAPTNRSRERRPAVEEERDAFRPLDGIGRLADQVGEKTQGLLTLPDLNRPGKAENGRDSAETDRPRVIRAPAERRPSGEEPGPRAETTADGSSGETGTDAPSPERGERTRLVGRSVEPDREERRRAQREAVRDATARVGRPSAEPADPVRPGEEKFELDDVVASGGSQPSGGFLQSLAGGRRSDRGKPDGMGQGESLLKRLAPSGRTEGSGGQRRPEEIPSGPLADDASLHVVRGPRSAEFYPFGDDSSSSITLPAGAVVRVTKPGEEWAGIETRAGRSGIIRSERLRRALQREASSADVPETVANEPKREPSKRLTLPPELTRPRPPESDGDEDLPLGHGLLPPLVPGEF